MNCPNSDFRDSEVFVTSCEMHVDETARATEVNVVMSIFSVVAGQKWLNLFSITFLVLLYLAASLLVHNDVFETNQFSPSTIQIVACLALVAILCGAVFLLPEMVRTPKWVPSAPWMALVSLSSLSVCDVVAWVAQMTGNHTFAVSWPGTLLYILMMSTTCFWLHRTSKSNSFGRGHVTYLACGALVWTVLTAILNAPMGNVTVERKVIHGMTMILLVLIACSAAIRNSNKFVRMSLETKRGDLQGDTP